MIRGFDQKGNPAVRSHHRPHRPRHAGHLLAHQPAQRQDRGARGQRGGALGGGAVTRGAGLRHRQGDLGPTSRSRTCGPSSSSTRTPSCASGPTPPTTCTASASAWPTRTSSARYRDVAVTVGSRYDAVAGANWVVGEVTARIIANVDAPVNTNWDVADGTLRGGPGGRRPGASSAWPSWPSTSTASSNESEFRFAIGLLGIGQFGTGASEPGSASDPPARPRPAARGAARRAARRHRPRARDRAASSSGPRCRRSRRSWPPSAAPGTASASTPAPTRCCSP